LRNSASNPGAVGLRLAKLGQQSRREIFGSTGHGDGNASALQSLQGEQRLIRFLQRLQNLTRMAEQNFASLGQEDALADPFEQQGAADFLELLDLQ